MKANMQYCSHLIVSNAFLHSLHCNQMQLTVLSQFIFSIPSSSSVIPSKLRVHVGGVGGGESKVSASKFANIFQNKCIMYLP